MCDDQQVADPVERCQPCVRWVRILDEATEGDNAFLTHGPVRQYVNLPREARFVNVRESVRRSLDRLGHTVRLRVKFTNASARFQYRLRALDGNVDYGGAEKGAKPQHYQMSEPRPGSWTAGPGGGIEVDISVRLDAAGGNQYMVDVKCTRCDRVLEAGPFVVYRRFWVAPMRMRRVPMARTRGLVRTLQGHLRPMHIEIRSLPERMMEDMVLTGESEDDRETIVRTATSPYRRTGALNLQPQVMALVHVDQLSDKEEHRIDTVSTELSRGERYDFAISSAARDRYLWWDMGEPGGWFIDCKFLRSDGREVILQRQHLTPLQQGAGSARNRITRLRLDVEHVLDQLGTETTRGRLWGRVYIADGFLGGFSDRQSNIVVLADRSRWRDIPDGSRARALAHETAHFLGMVPTANRELARGLDASPTCYEGHGHTGRHCYRPLSGIAAAGGRNFTRAEINRANCLMFGCNGPRARNFCDGCSLALRKVDMCEGFTSFLSGGWNFDLW